MKIDDAIGINISSPIEFQQLSSDLVRGFSLKREKISMSDSLNWSSVLFKEEKLGFFDRIRGIDKIHYRQVFTYKPQNGKHNFSADWFRIKNGNYEKIDNYTKGSINTDDVYTMIINWNAASNRLDGSVP